MVKKNIVYKTNLEAIRARKEKVGKTGKGGKKGYLNLKDGISYVRIMPNEKGDPFYDMSLHYNVGVRSGLRCLRSIEKACVVCDFGWDLYNEAKDSGSKKTLDRARDILPKQRYFANVVERGKEEEGSKIWGFSETVYESLIGFFLDPDYGDLADIDQGFDIKIIYGKKKDERFATTTVSPRPKTSTLLPKGAKITLEELFDGVVDIEGQFVYKSEEEVEEVLQKFIQSQSEDEASRNDDGEEGEGEGEEEPEGKDVEDAWNETVAD